MKHKVGDKVRVRKDLVIDAAYGGQSIVEDMDIFLGSEVIISKVHDDDSAYEIEGDEDKWWFTDEMLED
jgi:hypothetical protein